MIKDPIDIIPIVEEELGDVVDVDEFELVIGLVAYHYGAYFNSVYKEMSEEDQISNIKSTCTLVRTFFNKGELCKKYFLLAVRYFEKDVINEYLKPVQTVVN